MCGQLHSGHLLFWPWNDLSLPFMRRWHVFSFCSSNCVPILHCWFVFFRNSSHHMLWQLRSGHLLECGGRHHRSRGVPTVWGRHVFAGCSGYVPKLCGWLLFQRLWSYRLPKLCGGRLRSCGGLHVRAVLGWHLSDGHWFLCLPDVWRRPVLFRTRRQQLHHPVCTGHLLYGHGGLRLLGMRRGHLLHGRGRFCLSHV